MGPALKQWVLALRVSCLANIFVISLLCVSAVRLSLKQRINHILNDLDHDDRLTSEFTKSAGEEVDALSEVCFFVCERRVDGSACERVIAKVLSQQKQYSLRRQGCHPCCLFCVLCIHRLRRPEISLQTTRGSFGRAASTNNLSLSESDMQCKAPCWLQVIFQFLQRMFTLSMRRGLGAEPCWVVAAIACFVHMLYILILEYMMP